MTKRQCGDCQLCCKLVPVVEIEKAAGQRCPHQRHHKGCTIYKLRPMSCQLWSCRWLVDPQPMGLPRPDRCHYVVDVMPDYVDITYNDEPGDKLRVPIIQVWVDPDYRDAHRDPTLREFIAAQAGHAAVIRYSGDEAFVLFPPALSSNRQWNEVASGAMRPRTPVEEHAALIAKRWRDRNSTV